jgi:hypothetical protein
MSLCLTPERSPGIKLFCDFDWGKIGPEPAFSAEMLPEY